MNAQGKQMDASYFWRKETYCRLPMFAMQSLASGETICFSRTNADVTLGSVDRIASENYVDPRSNIGALGISHPKSEALLYTFYNADIRMPINAQTDGLEGILDAYVFLHNQGEDHSDWLNYCELTADWLCANQNKDGSYYRSYNYDGTMCMDSKANTPSVIRFLVEMYIVLRKPEYKAAAISAGNWTYGNLFLNMEYRGGTCDNMDIQDKEAGIYAQFAFLALYDLTEDPRWIKAYKGASDYVETFTYIWNFPIATPYPAMPFNKNHISGQSHITVGPGSADVYMACGSYVYYRLYLLTGDRHYLDYAEFIHRNSKQANDVDGSFGYAIPGLVHESGFFCEQLYRGNYHWLPWCTFVEVDPVSRLYDTFGVYEIADAEKLPLEERLKRNKIYQNWYR